ncbi:TetR/AcrR family transcriptional regulator [Leifsonia sp. Root112D2]|jgi:AcrR family transcriptional regulator|uniref:TetR/AcrR family transcriptional regulator n=1 Tax=Leifsonia sp. Root112D2 TaxID=1736426 RepID=UPI0009E7CB58|nr:TetR/AcrR family transcriptional regulator [Leifsonia sp. Root112D2]
MTDPARSDARERILSAAYDLFSQRGVRDVGVDELIGRSGVANATFYRHFPSKDDLVIAFLQRREQLWTLGTIVAQALERAGTAREQLLAVFDVFDEWFRRRDYEGDPFVNVLLEMGPKHALGHASLQHLDTVRRMIRQHAEAAQLRDPESFARSWQILMNGSIVDARMGDIDAAKRAKAMASQLIEQHAAA